MSQHGVLTDNRHPLNAHGSWRLAACTSHHSGNTRHGHTQGRFVHARTRAHAKTQQLARRYSHAHKCAHTDIRPPSPEPPSRSANANITLFLWHHQGTLPDLPTTRARGITHQWQTGSTHRRPRAAPPQRAQAERPPSHLASPFCGDSWSLVLPGYKVEKKVRAVTKQFYARRARIDFVRCALGESNAGRLLAGCAAQPTWSLSGHGRGARARSYPAAPAPAVQQQQRPDPGAHGAGTAAQRQLPAVAADGAQDGPCWRVWSCGNIPRRTVGRAPPREPGLHGRCHAADDVI